MRPLRRESIRPGLVVDDVARRLLDPVTGTHVGCPGPWGRERCLYALPFNKEQSSPLPWAAHTALHDPDGGYIADADGNLIGRPGVWINRLLHARWTEDTRRLAG